MAKLVEFLLLSALFCIVSGDVTFFEYPNHRGNTWIAYHDVDCQQFPSAYNKWASSVNTAGDCIKVYEHRRCRGKMALIAPGTNCHADLSECGMNKRISSFKGCDMRR